eukprot:3439689-Amphidinium_carterae.1
MALSLHDFSLSVASHLIVHLCAGSQIECFSHIRTSKWCIDAQAIAVTEASQPFCCCEGCQLYLGPIVRHGS